MSASNLEDEESKLEKAISYLLITGVMVSISLEIAGIALFYRSFGNFDISRERMMFVHGKNLFYSIYGLFRGGYAHDNGIFLMTLGMTILILTPYARVVMSVLYFVWKRDIKYALITIFVLLILTMSLIGH